MFNFLVIGYCLLGLVVSHCDPGFIKERIENSVDYVCKKTDDTLTDQEVLDQLADLEVEQPEVVEVEDSLEPLDQSSQFVTDIEEVFVPVPNTAETQREAADGVDATSNPTTSTSFYTSSTSSLTSSSGSTEEVLQNMEEDTTATSLPLPSTSSTSPKYRSRTLARRMKCRVGYEAHNIEGSDDYACKPKLSAPQNQEVSPEFTCHTTGNEQCCTIKISNTSAISGKNFYKMACQEGFALKSFVIQADLPRLECCKLPKSQ